MRGMLTDEVKIKSLELLGYEISLLELRLLPYAMYLGVNNLGIDPRKVNDKERKILAEWNKKGFIESSINNLSISKEFYDIANELIFIAYIKQCGNQL